MLSAPALAILQASPRAILPDGSTRDLMFGAGQFGFHDWSGSKVDLDGRILAARKAAARQAGLDPEKVGPMPHWVLHDLRRYLSTTMHEELGIAPHIVEAILGHAGGHRRGVSGVYNRAQYRAEKARALAIWAEHLRSITEAHDRKVVPLHA